MSRSFRKNLIITDGQKKKSGSVGRSYNKRQANRRIRSKGTTEEIPDGKYYKKEFNSWDICDYKFRQDETLEEYLNYKMRYK